MNKIFINIGVIILLAISLVPIGVKDGLAEETQYTFYFVSHIGPSDPNIRWLKVACDDFMNKFPEVKIVYLAPEQFGVKPQVELLKTAIATDPDGLIVPITDALALEPYLKEAIANGIPVIAANIPDHREGRDKIPYLTYVGGDEYRTGLKLGERAIELALKGTIPSPKRAVVAIQGVGHLGLEARAKGMQDALARVGVKTDSLAIGSNQAIAKSVLKSFLTTHSDVNVIFSVASWTAPWCYEVAKELNMDPDVDDKGVTILTVDASPAALEGILRGKVLATHSQGFYLQGWLPAQWLYFYNKFGYTPPPEILTGPIVIDKSNVEQWKKLVMTVFGKKTYDELILWPEEK
jgi:simple sugar transport system substrate-binding protein